MILRRNLKYSGFRKISIATQRSFARNKEIGGWILDDGRVGKITFTEKLGGPISGKPHNARSAFHTHQWTNKVFENHSYTDLTEATIVFVLSLMFGRWCLLLAQPQGNDGSKALVRSIQTDYCL